MKKFSVEFALADSEFLTALRLVAGAVCTVADVDIDSMEDFKVCVTESALILKNGGFESVKASFFAGGGVRAEIEGEGGAARECDNGLSLALISALMDKCDIIKKGDIINKVLLEV